MSFVPAIPEGATDVPFKTFHVAGIKIKVFGLDKLSNKSKDLAVAFLLHGRGSDAEAIKPAIWHLNNKGALEANEGRLQLLLVTIDHRNHGERTVDFDRNGGWTEGNLSHAADMISIQNGTAHDVSLIMDYFESVLFPQAEHVVTKWICMGASLGGHSTWIAGARDPRISYLCPIIGSPSMLTLLRHRADKSNPPLSFGPPLIPDSLLERMKKTDPAEGDLAVWQGKNILVLSGAKDQLVNYVHGGSEAFVDRLKQQGVAVEAYVQPKTGHRVTDEMLTRIASWLKQICDGSLSSNSKL